jgi:hypothetical protein
MKGAGDSASKLPTTPKREESPRGSTSDRTSLISKKDDSNLALLASMKRKPKKHLADSPSASEQHLSKFLEDTHDSPSPGHEKHEELGETVSSDEDELSRSYTKTNGTGSTGAGPMVVSAVATAGAAVASQDESSSHMGDTTETTGLARKNRSAIRSFYEGGAVALNPSQSFSAADTESSIGSFKGAPPKRRIKSPDDESDDYLDDDGSSVSVSYDDSAASESSASRHDGSHRTLPGAGKRELRAPPGRAVGPPAASSSAGSSSSSSASVVKRESLAEEKNELLDEIASLDMQIVRAKRHLEPELEVVILRMELEAKERMWNCLRVATTKKV